MREKVYEYVEVTDATPIQKLSFMDQLRVLFNKLTYDPSQELKNDDAVTTEIMTRKADLLQLLVQATEPIRTGDSFSVEVDISSIFEPVLDEVLDSKRFANFYSITVKKPQVEYNIKYMITVVLEVKK